MFLTGDFNAHSQFCWPNGDITDEGTDIDELFTNLVISEPTDFEPHKNSSCVDLLVTDHPNSILDSRTRASLDFYCHHQIIHCKVNFRIPPLPFQIISLVRNIYPTKTTGSDGKMLLLCDTSSNNIQKYFVKIYLS